MHHGMTLWRADGSQETLRLETRSMLLHDLVHFAVETAAGLGDGFYGRLARGTGYAALAAGAGSAPDEALMAIERVVGAVQGAWRDGFDADRVAARLADYLPQVGAAVPAWLTADCLRQVAATLRRLEGAWRATPFGEALELHFAEAALGR